MSKAIKTVYRNGHIQLPPEIHLPENAQVTVILPDHSSAEGPNHSGRAIADSAADIRREDLTQIIEDDPAATARLQRVLEVVEFIPSADKSG
jgi:hypothetical protein